MASAALASISEHLLEDHKFERVYLGKCQSDKIEGTFGKFRQVNGGNLYASVRQFLEADRSEKIKKLAKLNLDQIQIKGIFSDNVQFTNLEIESSCNEILKCLITEDSIEITPGGNFAYFFIGQYI